MAVEHARVCAECERECPSWAVRCPVCGSLSLVHRITIVPPAPLATLKGPAKGKRTRAARGRHSGRDTAHGSSSSARSSA